MTPPSPKNKINIIYVSLLIFNINVYATTPLIKIIMYIILLKYRYLVDILPKYENRISMAGTNDYEHDIMAKKLFNLYR